MNPLREEQLRVEQARARLSESNRRLLNAKSDVRCAFAAAVRSPPFLVAAFSMGLLSGSGRRTSGQPRRSFFAQMIGNVQKLAVAVVSAERLQNVFSRFFARQATAERER